MERAGTLINKLKEQYDQQASAEKLAFTAQMLLVELQQNIPTQLRSSTITVVLPKARIQPDIQETETEMVKPIEPVAEKKEEETYFPQDPSEPAAMMNVKMDLKTTSTKTAQPKIMEFNSILANQTESLNERLKEHRVEVASTLQESPIRDLKKAIGLNDRFLFVNELFRGDENMYERSLRTINGFTIYPEAEYWIQRELKVKLGWKEENEAVKIFDQLIKRRFS